MFLLLFFPLALPTEFCIVCFFRFLVLLSDLSVVVSSDAGWSLLLLVPWFGLGCFWVRPIRVVVHPFRPHSSSEFFGVESNSSWAVSSSVDVMMLASFGPLKGSDVSVLSSSMSDLDSMDYFDRSRKPCTSSTSMSLSAPPLPAPLASCWLSGLSDIFMLFWWLVGCVCFVGFSWLLYFS